MLATEILDAVVKRIRKIAEERSTIAIAYSGGKDSTALLITALYALEGNWEKIKVVYSDTLIEPAPLRLWVELVKKGLPREVEFIETEPPEPLTFWWDISIRGYPPPNYKFRWCTKHLKTVPFKLAYGSEVIVATRASESRNRRRKVRGEYSEVGIEKYAPIFDLSDADVWVLIRELRDFALDIGLPDPEGLRELYSTTPRTGCWACTVVKDQPALNLYLTEVFEVRGNKERAYKVLSNARMIIMGLRKQREEKARGYTKLGPLTKNARAVAMSVFLALSEMNLPEYCWDGSCVHSAYGLLKPGQLTGMRHADALLRADPYELEEMAYERGCIGRRSTDRFKDIEWIREKALEIKQQIKRHLVSHPDSS